MGIKVNGKKVAGIGAPGKDGKSAYASAVEAGYSGTESDFSAALSKIDSICPFYAGSSAPANTNILWIDTTADTGGLKYHNGTEWVTVPVRYS